MMTILSVASDEVSQSWTQQDWEKIESKFKCERLFNRSNMQILQNAKMLRTVTNEFAHDP